MSAPRVFFYGSDQEWLDKALTKVPCPNCADELGPTGWIEDPTVDRADDEGDADPRRFPDCPECKATKLVLPVPESIVVPEQLHEGDVVWIVVPCWTCWACRAESKQPCVSSAPRSVVVASTTVTADADRLPPRPCIDCLLAGTHHECSHLVEYPGVFVVELAPLVPCEPPLTEIECPCLCCEEPKCNSSTLPGHCAGGMIPVPALAPGEVKAL